MATTITRIPTATLADNPSDPSADPIPPDWNSAHGYGKEPTKGESAESVYGTLSDIYASQRQGAKTFEDADQAQPATVSSISPATGLAAGGTVTTSTGTNLFGVTAVTFGGASATAVSVTSDGKVKATTPPHAAGAVTVVYTDNSGPVSKPAFYTYT